MTSRLWVSTQTTQMEMLPPRKRAEGENDGRVGARGWFLRRSKCLPRPALWGLRVWQALQNLPLMGPAAKLGKIRGFPSGINRYPVGRGDHGRKELKVGLGNVFTTRAARYLYSFCDLREGRNSLVP